MGFERLDDDVPIARCRELAGLLVDTDESDALRNTERGGWLTLERTRHEIAEDRRGDAGALLERTERPRLVEADPDAGHEVGREAHKPGVEAVVCGASLAGDRLADTTHDGARAALHDAFQHRHDLVGAERVSDLRALIGQRRRRLALPRDIGATRARPRVVAQDGLAVAVL